MGLIIQDGQGKGFNAGVTPQNRLRVSTIQGSIEHHVNHANQEAYNVIFVQAAAAGDDFIFYLENEGETDLVIEGVTLSLSGAGNISFRLNDWGTRNSAVPITPINLNSGSGRGAKGNFEQGSDLGGGGSTLSGGHIVDTLIFRAATNSDHFNFEQDVIITQNNTFTITCSTTVTVSATVVFNYHNADLVG